MPANTREHDTVTLEVRGGTLDELRERATELAAEFFGVPEEGAELRAGAIRARVTFYNTDNRPQGYQAEVTVRLLSAEEVIEEGQEPSEP